MLDYASNLKETLDTLRSMGLMPNLSKCTLRVSSGKFLGHIISSEGLQVNPKKVNILARMRSHNFVKKFQDLTGRIAALAHFLPCSIDQQLPFIRVLKQASKFKWTPECEEDFQQLKRHIAKLPRLAILQPNEFLYLLWHPRHPQLVQSSSMMKIKSNSLYTLSTMHSMISSSATTPYKSLP